MAIPSVLRLRRREYPSITARVVAITRGEIRRSETDEGELQVEDRLCRALRPRIWITPEGRRQRLAARTRFVDREAIAALDAGVHQVVIVGAGYDCRALRLRQSGTRFFEVDHPVTQEDKRGRLTALGVSIGDIAYLPVDFTNGSLREGLGNAGHRTEDRTLFICEGLLLYLPLRTVRTLLADISACAAPESRLVLTARAKSSPPKGRWSTLPTLALTAIGEPARSTFAKEDLLKLLAEHDFAPTRELAWPPHGRRQTLMVSAEAFDRGAR